jgi:hypothetical protein
VNHLFSKRLKTSVKKLEQRMSQYEADSPPALALQQQLIEQMQDLINIVQICYVELMVYLI